MKIMKNRITFDKAANFGYIYVFNKKYKYKIKETEELEANELIALDIDRENKIVGLEIFGEEAIYIKNNEISQMYKQIDDSYYFLLVDKPVKSSSTFLGIEFLFENEDYTNFIGYKILDNEKYKKELLI
ncbi:DUF2283 domain-containing protein [Bacillus sp. ms-22]|uniref:DUF2283 domain-containing protein n=1 Tax=Bacillus sp. ms-22 TaxID=2683680 RepID=UPI0012F8CBC2|nr:DUF2283 domain-containing protein [Bacillus sp. ms-22]QGX67010.1 DUF2283 domain-containing protein [Bacillus sp. ms-22]